MLKYLKICEAQIPSPCTQPASAFHHMRWLLSGGKGIAGQEALVELGKLQVNAQHGLNGVQRSAKATKMDVRGKPEEPRCLVRA